MFGTGTAAPGQPVPPASQSTLQRDLHQAQSDYAKAQAALNNGDLGPYKDNAPKKHAALNQAQKAAAAAARRSNPSRPASPSAREPPSASPSASPSR